MISTSSLDALQEIFRNENSTENYEQILRLVCFWRANAVRKTSSLRSHRGELWTLHFDRKFGNHFYSKCATFTHQSPYHHHVDLLLFKGRLRIHTIAAMIEPCCLYDIENTCKWNNRDNLAAWRSHVDISESANCDRDGETENRLDVLQPTSPRISQTSSDDPAMMISKWLRYIRPRSWVHIPIYRAIRP